jgi:FtsP/CotA-like multicopper oxidase with cupredoxin domain
MRVGSKKAALLFVAFALVLAACSSGDDSSGSGSGGDGEAAAGGTETVAVTLSDFKIQPNDVQVPSGTELSFEVTNEGPSPHTFAVTVGSETYDTGNIDAGASATLAVPALEAGQYDTLCTVPGHDQLGMVGTLTATAEGAAGATGAAGASGAAGEMTGMTAEEMAQGHEQGVLDFLAGKETDTYGMEPLAPEMDGKVKVFNLTVDEIKWEVSKGNFIDGMAFNGQIPGPEIRVHKGDRVRFVVQNQLEEPFALHFHGVTVPNDMDGVPYVTQPAIMPGEYWTYEYTIVDDPGMMIYHSHFNSAEQESAGLYGPLLIEPKQGGWKKEYGVKPDVEYTMFLGDGTLGYNLNAKSFPATQPIVAKEGDKVLFHLVNNGALLHPMHLHGFHFEVVAEDGFVLDPEDRYMADTIVVAPGQRFDIMVDADYPGAWAFHCHILPHAEGPAGMFGMVTALVVQ